MMAKAKKTTGKTPKSDSERTGKRIDAIRHAQDTRVLIPSQEEAGMEDDSPVVQRKHKAELPLNPVTTRGQDPELYWMHKYGTGDDEQRLSVDIRSLYRHEHVEPETLIHRLYKTRLQRATARRTTCSSTRHSATCSARSMRSTSPSSTTSTRRTGATA